VRLLRARIRNFKSIEDSGWVDIDQVTCLVDKNESGKTAWLHALRKLRPIPGDDPNFDYELEYPRKGLQSYKRVHQDKPATALEAVFELTDSEVAAIESEFGAGCVKEREVNVTKRYNNQTTFYTGDVIDEPAIVRHVVAEAGLSAATTDELAKLERIYTLRTKLETLGDEPPQAAQLLARIDSWHNRSATQEIIDKVLWRGSRSSSTSTTTPSCAAESPSRPLNSDERPGPSMRPIAPSLHCSRWSGSPLRHSRPLVTKSA
jgi:hypothetical protein